MGYFIRNLESNVGRFVIGVAVRKATAATREYLQMVFIMKEVLTSLRKPVKSHTDPKIGELFRVLRFFENWRAELKLAYPGNWKHRFVTAELYKDLRLLLNAVCCLVEITTGTFHPYLQRRLQ